MVGFINVYCAYRFNSRHSATSFLLIGILRSPPECAARSPPGSQRGNNKRNIIESVEKNKSSAFLDGYPMGTSPSHSRYIKFRGAVELDKHFHYLLRAKRVSVFVCCTLYIGKHYAPFPCAVKTYNCCTELVMPFKWSFAFSHKFPFMTTVTARVNKKWKYLYSVAWAGYMWRERPADPEHYAKC